jgi:hypothetical protein
VGAGPAKGANRPAIPKDFSNFAPEFPEKIYDRS